MMKSQSESGFTLIELLLAMTLFSFGLLVIVVGFLALLGYYQNGTQSRVVQTAARNGTNAISQAGRTSQWMAYVNKGDMGVTYSSICMFSNGGVSLMFYLDPAGANPHQLMEANWDYSKGCSPGVAASSAPKPVTSPDAQVSNLTLETIGGYTNLVAGLPILPCIFPKDCSTYSIKAENIRVSLTVTSQIGQLDPATNNTSCKPSAPAYCVVTTLSTDMDSGEYTEN